jgi:hypothetical protein
VSVSDTRIPVSFVSRVFVSGDLQMYGDQLRYHLLVFLVIMLLLLMMQLGKLRFIVFEKKLMFLILLRNGKLWLRMRQERG